MTNSDYGQSMQNITSYRNANVNKFKAETNNNVPALFMLQPQHWTIYQTQKKEKDKDNTENESLELQESQTAEDGAMTPSSTYNQRNYFNNSNKIFQPNP